jgi:AcrR family transcriptional regulator
LRKQSEKNREKQTIRMMSYFIDATAAIIEKEGIDKVTIRKIADLAGYNSATIYNYFEDLSHLIFFASMSVVKKYTDALPKYIEKAKTPLERYFLIWECFCKYSFESPKIYYAVFSADLGTHPINLTKYYEFSPTDLLEFDDDIKLMLLESNQSKRTAISLNQCIREGYIQGEDVEQIAENHYLIWQGMITMVINNRTTYTVDEATKVTVNHIRNNTPIKK